MNPPSTGCWRQEVGANFTKAQETPDGTASLQSNRKQKLERKKPTILAGIKELCEGVMILQKLRGAIAAQDWHQVHQQKEEVQAASQPGRVAARNKVDYVTAVCQSEQIKQGRSGQEDLYFLTAPHSGEAFVIRHLFKKSIC